MWGDLGCFVHLSDVSGCLHASFWGISGCSGAAFGAALRHFVMAFQDGCLERSASRGILGHFGSCRSPLTSLQGLGCPH